MHRPRQGSLRKSAHIQIHLDARSPPSDSDDEPHADATRAKASRPQHAIASSRSTCLPISGFDLWVDGASTSLAGNVESGRILLSSWPRSHRTLLRRAQGRTTSSCGSGCSSAPACSRFCSYASRRRSCPTSSPTGPGAISTGWWQPSRQLAGAVVLAAVRWRQVLRTLGLKIGLYRLTMLHLAAKFVGNFLPTTVGGTCCESGACLASFRTHRAHSLQWSSSD